LNIDFPAVTKAGRSDGFRGDNLSPIALAGIAFALILGSTILGTFLRSRLPEQHLTGDSKEVIRLATALIATMSAVVLALLFASTRASFEQTSSYVSRMTADITELDELLAEYGPEASLLRKQLRDEVGPIIASIWREEEAAGGTRPLIKSHSETVLYMLRELKPQTPVQSSLQARALLVSTDMSQIRLILFAQPADSISTPFLTVLVLWLMFIFATFSMSATPNATLTSVLCICVLSASGAIYLILELALPFGGLMQVSNDTLRSALSPF
jgi:hypothetical protein